MHKTGLDERLQKIRNNPSDVSYHDLETVLIDQALIITRGKGSHTVFTYPDLHGLVNRQRRHTFLGYLSP